MAASRLSLLDKPPLRKLGAVAVSHLSLGGFRISGQSKNNYFESTTSEVGGAISLILK